MDSQKTKKKLIMLRSLLCNAKQCLLQPSKSGLYLKQTRNTFILKRKYAMSLSKVNGYLRHLKPSDYIYELVENRSSQRIPDIQCILTRTVERLGVRGDLVTIKRFLFRYHLYPAGFAVYASPENIEEFEEERKKALDSPDVYIEKSPFVQKTMRHLRNSVIDVVMNKDEPWQIENWHIKVALRRANIICTESTIKLPEKAITHVMNPNMNGKEFSIVITINNQNIVPVRCRLCLYSPKAIPLITEDTQVLPWGHDLLFPDLEDLEKLQPKQDDNVLDLLTLQSLIVYP